MLSRRVASRGAGERIKSNQQKRSDESERTLYTYVNNIFALTTRRVPGWRSAARDAPPAPRTRDKSSLFEGGGEVYGALHT